MQPAQSCPPRRRSRSRTETLSIRLSPQAEWMIEIAARIQRRTVSAFVSTAAESYASSLTFHQGGPTVGTAMQFLWDTDRSERIYKLAQFDRSLITFDEEQSLIDLGRLPVASFVEAIKTMEEQCKALTASRDRMKSVLSCILDQDSLSDADAKKVRALLEHESLT